MSEEPPIKKELLILVGIIIITEVTSWYFMKKSWVDNDKISLCLFFALYACLPFLLLRTLQYEGIGITNMLWNIASTTLVLLMGYFIFKEHINHWQYLGIGLGIISIVLLSLESQ